MENKNVMRIYEERIINNFLTVCNSCNVTKCSCEDLCSEYSLSVYTRGCFLLQ